MAACDVRVELEEPDRIYKAGEIIHGKVVVVVDSPVKCNGLTLSHFWKTHGRGNTNTGPTYAQTLFEGKWQESGQYEYDFSVEQHAGPKSYHGHLLNVDWFLRAEADIPWALDPDHEVDYLVDFDGPKQDYDFGATQTFQSGEAELQAGRGCALLFGFLFLVGSALLLLVFLSDQGEVGALIVSMVGTVISGGLIYAGVSRRLAKKKLGEIEVTISPKRIYPGELIQCKLQLTPPKPVEINKIRCALLAEEVVVRGSGTSSRTYRQQLHNRAERIKPARNGTLAANKTHVFEVSFEIPIDAPPSFASGNDNKLQWRVETEIDIPSWPDWKTLNYLIVVPGRPDAPEVDAADAHTGTDASNGPNDWW